MAVYRLADQRMKDGVHELGVSLGTNEKAFHVVQVLSVAVELLVWAVQDDAGGCGQWEGCTGVGMQRRMIQAGVVI